jgi:hypothetical protein
MKSFQVRLSDDVYEAIRGIAEARNTSLADVIRESLESYAIGCSYAEEGKQLFWEDPKTGTRAEIVIPGFTVRRLRPRPDAVGA